MPLVCVAGALRDGTPVDLQPVFFEDHAPTEPLLTRCVQKYAQHASIPIPTRDDPDGDRTRTNTSDQKGTERNGGVENPMLTTPRYHGQETPSVHWMHLFANIERAEGCNESCLELGKFICRRFNNVKNIASPSQVECHVLIDIWMMDVAYDVLGSGESHCAMCSFS